MRQSCLLRYAGALLKFTRRDSSGTKRTLETQASKDGHVHAEMFWKILSPYCFEFSSTREVMGYPTIASKITQKVQYRN